MTDKKYCEFKISLCELQTNFNKEMKEVEKDVDFEDTKKALLVLDTFNNVLLSFSKLHSALNVLRGIKK